MSEEKTEVVRTVAAVSVRPKAIPQEGIPEHLVRTAELLQSDVRTLREVATLAKEARGRLEGISTDMNGLRVFECLDQIVGLAAAAANKHGSGGKKA
jgi:hypothetical protein